MDLRTTHGLITALRSKRWQQEVEITWGVLGNGAGTVLTTRTNYYYVLPQGLQRVAQAINLGHVPPIPELMVELAEKDGAYAILGPAMHLPYWGDRDPYLPLHGPTHEAGEGEGRDPVNVYLRAITPLRADIHSPIDDSLAVAAGTYYDTATLDRVLFVGGDSPSFNLASSGSVSGSGFYRWDLLYLDTLTNTLQILQGTEGPAGLIEYPDPPWNSSTAAVPITYVYQSYGDITIAEDDLEDARQIISGVGIPQNAGWLRGYEICSGSPPIDGRFLRYDDPPGCWRPAPQAAAAPHNLLDGVTHPDTAVQGATRGSLIYGDSTPDWNELVIGGAHQLFKVNAGGTEPAWASFDWDDISAAAAADMVHDHSAAGEGGQVDVPDLTDTQAQLLTGVQKTDLTDGGQTVLHSHAGVTTSSVQITLLNNSGSQLVIGDVVVTGSAVNESVAGTTVVGYGGKVLVTAETIASGSSGLFWERGGPFNILTVGAISRNDGLRTAGTIFRAESAGAPTSGSVFAVALTPAVASGSVNGLFLDAEGGAGDAGNHNILDGDVHPDSALDAVTRGSIIVGSVTPLWDELLLGAAARYLRSDGADLGYAQIPGSEVTNTPTGGIAATDVQAAINELAWVGPNVISNPSFDRDGNADGIADYFVTFPGVYAMEGTIVLHGITSQKITTDALNEGGRQIGLWAPAGTTKAVAYVWICRPAAGSDIAVAMYDITAGWVGRDVDFFSTPGWMAKVRGGNTWYRVVLSSNAIVAGNEHALQIYTTAVDPTVFYLDAAFWKWGTTTAPNDWVEF